MAHCNFRPSSRGAHSHVPTSSDYVSQKRYQCERDVQIGSYFSEDNHFALAILVQISRKCKVWVAGAGDFGEGLDDNYYAQRAVGGHQDAH